MAQKRAARRGRRTVSSGSVELGHNGAKEPSPEGVEGSQSDYVREGSESTDEETAIRALEEEEEEEEKESEEEEKVSEEEEEESEEGEEDEKEREEEEEDSKEKWTAAPDPYLQLKRKRASDRVTRSQQPKVPVPAQQRRKEGEQPSQSKKPNSKKTTRSRAPLQEQISQSEMMPKSKKITRSRAPLQQQLSQSEMPKSKKLTPAPVQQQGEETAQPSGSEMPKSKRIRRTWTPSDEVQILTALLEHRREQGKLPEPDNNDFFDSVAERLEDKSCTRSSIKDKVRSLMRRYKSYVAPTTDHEHRLADLSSSIWGDLPATHAANTNNGDGERDEGEHAMAEAENSSGQTVDKSFKEMCEMMYPLLGQEVKRLAGVQPALRTSFTGLDGNKALLMEKKLDKLKWKELKIQAEMEAKVEAPKARVRKELVNFLSEVSKNV